MEDREGNRINMHLDIHRIPFAPSNFSLPLPDKTPVCGIQPQDRGTVSILVMW